MAAKKRRNGKAGSNGKAERLDAQRIEGDPPAADIEDPKGRDKKTGRFTPGNTQRKGLSNRHAVSAAQFRDLLHACVTPQAMKAILNKLIRAAKKGESWAIKEVLDRIYGKPDAKVKVEGNVEYTLSVVREGIDQLAARLGDGEVEVDLG